MTAVHGWSAVLLGLLLYLVVATGAVVVFAEEIGRWADGKVSVAGPFDGPIDGKIRRLAAEVDSRFHHDVGIWGGGGDEIIVFFHDHELHPESGEEEEFGTLFRVEAKTGAVLARHDGFIWRIEGLFPSGALTNFLVDLHVNLYLPHPWGLIATGVLGLMMLAAIVSGILIHRHLVRDLFLAERPGGRLAGMRDRHVLAGAWSIPFAFIFAFTGAFLSLAWTIFVPLIVVSAFGGDMKRFEEQAWPEHVTAADATAEPLASLDYIIADATERTGAPVGFVGIENYGRADARVSVWHGPPPGGLLGVGNEYEGPTRRFLGNHPPIGTEPSAGGTLYALMGPLHFGSFAGLLSKIVWVAAGVASCFVILTGFRLWCARRKNEALWRGFSRAVQASGYGVPFAMLTAAYGFFVARPAGDPEWWTPAGFFAGLAAAVLVAFRSGDPAIAAARFQRLLAVSCLLLPVVRLGTGGMTWADAVVWRQLDVLSVDVLLVIAAVAFWLVQRERQETAPMKAPAE